MGILEPSAHSHIHALLNCLLDMQVDKDGKGEDWEHEEERADDDVDMGEEGEDAEASPTPPK